MKKRTLAPVAAVLISMTALLVLLGLLSSPSRDRNQAVLAAPSALAVTEVEPSSAPNDLDSAIVITGTDFADGAAVQLGTEALEDAGWVSSTTLTGTVPWGLDPGMYTLTVENPDGTSASLTDPFTVTDAIGVWNAGEFYGGSVEAVLINPITPTTLYASSERVGVFRSQDSAETWSFVASSNDVRHFVMAPADPDTLYTFMGRQQTYGLHRSDDGGDTWTELDVDGDRAFPHPDDPDTVYVAQEGDEGGLWRSPDRGETWTSITSGLTDTHVTALAFRPTDALTIYAGTGSGNLFVSPDGGDSWSFVDQPTNFIQELAVNPRGDHELWVSSCCFCTPRETLRSTNASLTAWTTVTDPVGSNSMQTIAFPPDAWGGSTYSQTVFVNSCWGECHRTDDNGASWSQFGPTTGGWGLTLHPTDPDVAHRSSHWEGVIKTTDGGTSWQVVNEGLTAVVPEQLEIVPDRPDTLYARTGRPEGVYKGTRGGETWRFQTISTKHPNSGLDSMLVDPVTPTRVYAGEWGMEQAYFHIGEDSGDTWGTPVPITITEAFTDCPSFISTLAAHETQPGMLVLGVDHMCMGVPGVHAGDIYTSSDAGRSWDRATISGMDTISPVVDIVHDELTPTILYAATSWDHRAHGLLRSTDGGQSWEPIRQVVSELDDVQDLAAEKAPPYRIFAWGGAATGLYVSTDHGDNWAKANAPLNGYHVEEILCTDEDPSWLYAAVSQSWSGPGLYRSEDGAQSWERATGELGRVPVYSADSVRVDDRVFLYAGTTGGYVGETDAQAFGTARFEAATQETLVNAGVYRYTRRPARKIYVPLVLKTYASE
ncbi:MAG: IPT/TIG domain-containing protein [Chloroflexota bacterium]